MIEENLFERLDVEAARRMSELTAKAREGRKRALASLPRNYVVAITRDGESVTELAFDQPPTVEELAAAARGCYVVAVRMVRTRTLRERLRQMLAAE